MRKGWLLVMLMLTGCAAQQQKPWYKEGGTEEQFRRDSMACQQYGMNSATANGVAGNMFVSIWIRDEAIKCMNNLGYKQY